MAHSRQGQLQPLPAKTAQKPRQMPQERKCRFHPLSFRKEQRRGWYIDQRKWSPHTGVSLWKSLWFLMEIPCFEDRKFDENQNGGVLYLRRTERAPGCRDWPFSFTPTRIRKQPETKHCEGRRFWRENSLCKTSLLHMEKKRTNKNCLLRNWNWDLLSSNKVAKKEKEKKN